MKPHKLDHRNTGLAARLWRAQKERCYICGQFMVNDGAKGVALGWSKLKRRYHLPTLEHVVPLTRGGKDGDNRLLAHAICNTKKGNRPPHPCELLYLEAMLNIIGRQPAQGAYRTSRRRLTKRRGFIATA